MITTFSQPTTSVPTSLKSSKTYTDSAQSLVEIAPTGVSSWSGPQIEMKRAAEDSLTVHLRIPLCSIGCEATGTAVNFGNGYNALAVYNRSSFGASGTLDFRECLCLSPTLLPCLRTTLTQYSQYIANPDCSLVNLLAAGFSKYRMRSDLKLHYLPQTTTVDPVSFALCFSDDPCHPMVGTGAYTSGKGASAPSFATTKNSVNSVVFASWSTWSKSFPLDRDSVYFTTTSYGSGIAAVTIGDTPPFDPANLRFSHFGALQCYASSLSGAASFAIKGELYMEFSIELFDFVPIAGAASIPFSLNDWSIYSDLLLAPNIPGFDDEDYASELCSDAKSESKVKRPAQKLLAVFDDSKFRHHEQATASRSIFSRYSMKTKGGVMKKALKSSVRSTKAPKQKASLHTVITHLNKHVLRLPLKARPQIRKLNELANKKPKAWQEHAKGIVKTLVKDVPVVGPILSEITDLFGGSVLDWISGLF